MKTGLRWAVALAAAVIVSAVPAPPAGASGTCVRTISIAPQASAGEGTGRLTFSVSSGGCAAAGNVGFVVTAGTAVAGADFLPPSGQLSWAAGDDGIRTITATIVRDLEPEADLEDFTVSLVNPSSAVRIARSSGQGRILDDDGGELLSTIDDSSCDKVLVAYKSCDSNCLDERMPIDACVVDLDLSKPLSDPETFRWETLDGTAVAGVDFVGVAGQTLTLQSGDAEAGLEVRLLPRPAGIPARWFMVRIFAASTGRIADSIAVVTIEGS